MVPENVFMLLSWVNMKLRDEFDSFEELCRAEDLEMSDIEVKLAEAGFNYVKELNQFK